MERVLNFFLNQCISLFPHLALFLKETIRLSFTSADGVSSEKSSRAMHG